MVDDISGRGLVGIVAHGSYLPHHRLRRGATSLALGEVAAPETRSVAGYDEDSTTMAVEASRIAVRRLDEESLRGIYFATSTAAYGDKTNATAVQAALGLPAQCLAVDMGGALRSSWGAWRAGLDAASNGRSTLTVAA